MVILYNIISIVFILLYLPYLVVRGKWHAGLWQRMGKLDEPFRQAFADGDFVWLHAVSVGEVLAVRGLFDEIRARCPGRKFVLSTVTVTGYTLAKKTFPDVVVIFAPLDLSWVVERFIALIRPRAYITAETEIWPNIMSAMKRHSVPVAVVNGRISDRTFKRYSLVRGLLRPVLQGVDLFCMQTPVDRERITTLGARPEKVRVAGNVKFDIALSADEDLWQRLGLPAGDPLWVAGSTHPGEEEIVLRVFTALKQDFPQLRLVLAPRHVERSDEVADLAARHGLSVTRLSRILDGQERLSSHPVLLVDTIGHLRSLYSFASVVFVGKSLAGKGGQNIIEPAGFAKPVAVGPHMENFRDVLKAFLDDQAVCVVRDEQELLDVLRQWLIDPQQSKALGEKALGVVRRHQGAAGRTLQELKTILPFLS